MDEGVNNRQQLIEYTSLLSLYSIRHIFDLQMSQLVLSLNFTEVDRVISHEIREKQP